MKKIFFYRLFFSILLVFVCVGSIYRLTTQASKQEELTTKKLQKTTETAEIGEISNVKTNLTQEETKTPSEALARQLVNSWQETLADSKAIAALAFYAPKNQTVVIYSNQPTALFESASIAKVAVLAEVLKKTEEKGTFLTEKEQAMARQMITKSDNDVTHAFMKNELGGYLGLNPLFQTLEMTQTISNKKSWGLTKTTAEDQLKLLNEIFYERQLLANDSANFIQKLMGSVVENQRWGIGRQGEVVYLKNGWLSLDDKTWLVHSIGHVERLDYNIAILTKENASFASGKHLVTKLAEQTYELVEEQQKKK